MRVGVALGVFACGLLGVSALPAASVAQAPAQTPSKEARVHIPPDIVVNEAHITFIKSALNLRPAQLPLWAPVEAALYEMARWQARASADTAESESARVRSEAAVAARLKRIVAAAAPLIRALDDNQKSTMEMLARSAGLELLLPAN